MWYMCVCACVCACVCVCTLMHEYVLKCMYTPTWASVWMHIHVYVYTHMWACVCVNAYSCVNMYPHGHYVVYTPREGMWRLEVNARCPTPACSLHYFLRPVKLQLPACLDWFASEPPLILGTPLSLRCGTGVSDGTLGIVWTLGIELRSSCLYSKSEVSLQPQKSAFFKVKTPRDVSTCSYNWQKW